MTALVCRVHHDQPVRPGRSCPRCAEQLNRTKSDRKRNRAERIATASREAYL